MSYSVYCNNLSKWYGKILGISEISLELGKGVYGLLGPNGAGKSTFLKILSGQLKQSLGEVKIFNESVFNNNKLFKKIGYCAEYDSFYSSITGYEFIEFIAKLHGIKGKELKKNCLDALELTGMMNRMNDLINTYSLGMRQRLKLSASLVNRGDLLILDEPLRGIDPLWRLKIINLIRELGKEDKTVIVSSHILPEIESMTDEIILIHQGKVFANGNIDEIRNLLDSHPHQISIVSNKYRKIAKDFVDKSFILEVDFDDEHNKVVFQTKNRNEFFSILTDYIVDNEIEIDELSSPDSNLQSVFEYVVGGKS